jgi:hypothetical protein
MNKNPPKSSPLPSKWTLKLSRRKEILDHSWPVDSKQFCFPFYIIKSVHSILTPHSEQSPSLPKRLVLSAIPYLSSSPHSPLPLRGLPKLQSDPMRTWNLSSSRASTVPCLSATADASQAKHSRARPPSPYPFYLVGKSRPCSLHPARTLVFEVWASSYAATA